MKAALAPQGYDAVLAEELGDRLLSRYDRLMFYEGKDPVWAQNIWLEVKTASFRSIAEAANVLRAIQRNWWLHSTSHHRRAALIQAKLPHLKPKPLSFPGQAPVAPLGGFTLLDESTMPFRHNVRVRSRMAKSPLLKTKSIHRRELI